MESFPFFLVEDWDAFLFTGTFSLKVLWYIAKIKYFEPPFMMFELHITSLVIRRTIV